MTTEFALIRHGQTNWNVDRRYQGSSHTPLNEEGVRQAAALAEAMRGEHWDVIASSPLPRAWATALPLAEALGKSLDAIIPDERLVERRFGVAEGLTLLEREEQYPGDIWEGLEPREELGARSMGAMEDYLAQYRDRRIILVSHGTWITSVLEVVTKGEFGYGRSVILNTGRTFITHDEDGWRAGDISLIPQGIEIS